MKKYWSLFLYFIKKPENVFISLSLFFGVLSAILVPQLSVSDENMHYLRAYGISQGRVESGSHCTLPKDVAKRAGSVYEGNFSADYSKPIDRNTLDVDKCSSASGYPPIMHLPQAIGINIANLFGGSTGLTILFGRLANVLFYSIAVYLIIKWVRIGKWAFTAIGLIPLMIHMAASLSSDCMTNVAVFTITAFTLNLFTQKDKLSHKQTVALICIGVFLTLTKSVNALLLFPLLFLPKRLFSPNKNERLPFNIQKWTILVVTGIAAIISILIWQKIFGQPLLTLGAAHNPLHSNPLKFIAILFNTYINPTIGYTDVVLRGSVGDFSSFKYHLPLFVLIPLFSLLFLSLLHYNKKDQELLGEQTGKLAVYNLATIGLFVCAVSYAMYTAWALLPFRFGEGAYYADGVQGRYFTATAVMLVPVGLWLQKYINVRTKNEKVFNLIMFFGLALVLGFYVFETVWTYK